MNQQVSKENIVTYMSFNDYEYVRANLNKKRLEKMQVQRKKEALYYKKQRLLGLVIMLVGIICLSLGCILWAKPMEYFGLIAGIAGLYVMFTPQMILIDRYYLERKDKTMRID